MKKMFLMLGVAAAAMTSCTSDEVLEMNPANTIKFESFVNKSTRAVTEINDQNQLTNFYVFGGYEGNNVFDNDGATTGDTEKNWVLNKIYDFAAYADGNGGQIVSESDNDVPLVSFVGGDDDQLTITNYTVSDAKDLVAAVTPNVQSGSNAVHFTFKHLLSQVSFEFINNSDYYMEVTPITFTAYKKGDCDVTDNSIEWSNWAGSEMYTYDGTATNYLAPKSNTVYAKYTPDYQMVIPQALSNVKASFKVNFYQLIGETYVNVDSYTYTDVVLTGTVPNGDGDNVTVNVAEWEPSHRYKYVAYFPANPSTIKFTASVDSWIDDNVDDNEDDHEVIF